MMDAKIDEDDRKIDDNKGLGVVRIKPLGAGGGGGESSSKTGVSAIKYTKSSVSVKGKRFEYPKMIVDPSMKQDAVFYEFMPSCIDGFFEGYNVNLIAYGQTGSGKTHTIFGPPGCMDRAAKGEYGLKVHEDYGLFPRSLINIFSHLKKLNEVDTSNSYVITCAAVEISALGNNDLFKKSGYTQRSFSSKSSVSLERIYKPPRLYGQIEFILEKDSDLLHVFRAISVRNTSATMLNDSSSRSHCIIWLTLWKYEKSVKKVDVSRLQFCDLAGSERMQHAHKDGASYMQANREYNMDIMQGLCTNYSLMELSKCLQDIAQFRKSKKKFSAKEGFSFRAYMTDLLLLLSGSLLGNALTACFICVSQAEANQSQSKSSLEFGKRFSKLSICRKKVTPKFVSVIAKKAQESIKTHKEALKTTSADNRYAIQRKAKIRENEQILNVLHKFNIASLSSEEKS